MALCLDWQRSRLLPLEQTLRDLDSLAASSDHVLAWWIPYTQTAQVSHVSGPIAAAL